MESRPYDLSAPEARNPLVATTALSAIATITTIIRFAARKVQNLSYQWDDYLLLLGLFSGYIELSLYWCAVILGGTGRHMADIAFADVLLTLKFIVPFEILYNVSMSGIKLSILAFYFRLFSTDRLFRRCGLAIGSFIVVFAVASIITIFFICRPFAFSWDPSIPGGKCGNRNAMYIANGAFNILIDLLILILPLRTIHKLQLPTTQKLGLVLCFSLGLFVTVISIIRIHYLMAVEFSDVTYTCVGALAWTCLEEYILTINANLPMLRYFFKAVFPQAFGSLTYPPTYRSNMAGNTNSSQIEGPTKTADYLELQDMRSDVYCGQDIRSGNQPSITTDKDYKSDGPAIMVTRDWNIS